MCGVCTWGGGMCGGCVWGGGMWGGCTWGGGMCGGCVWGGGMWGGCDFCVMVCLMDTWDAVVTSGLTSITVHHEVCSTHSRVYEHG